MTQTLAIQQISSTEMAAFTDLIYKTAGVRIPQEKISILSNRIRRRLKATGIETFGEYLKALRSLVPTDPEWDAFLQEITTHETYLFRDEHHWTWLRDEFLSQVAKDARAGLRPKALRVWSAAASTGDEAYSIACCVADRIRGHSDWAIEIVGTDIGAGALEDATAGVFRERAMRLVSAEYQRRYFDHNKNGQLDSEDRWTAKPVLKKMIKFAQHNLLKPLLHRPFDLVFVKNVLIYFDKASKIVALRHVKKVLKPNGFLVSGPAEGVSDLLTSLERVQPWLYRASKTMERSGQ